MVCALFGVSKLPHVTTYWRYVASLGINQGKSLLLVMAALRERVWKLCEISYSVIHVNLDTTVETIFGDQEGGRKGHNTRYRGKKDFVLSWVSLRRRESILSESFARARPSLAKKSRR